MAAPKLSLAVIKCLTIACTAIFLAGCACRPKAWAVKPCPIPSAVDADCAVWLRSIRLQGAITQHKSDPYEALGSRGLPKDQENTPEGWLLAGLSKAGPEIVGTTRSEGADAVLDAVIDTRYSLMSKLLRSGGTLNFHWYVNVAYTLRDAEGGLLLDGKCEIRAKDSMTRTGLFDVFGASLLGARYVERLYYPDREARDVLAPEILLCAGCEIGKRLRGDPAQSYFVARTKARDGMDHLTYAKFLAKKKRMQEERAWLRTNRQREMQASVEDEQAIATLGPTMVVFGVGVDEYEHYPCLRYASRDCRRVVELFRSRYGLSKDRAMALTDEDATAIKVGRFVSRNAARLLDEDDTFVFYFSGHGAPDVDAASRDGDGLRKYLLLSNSEPDALPITALSLDNLASMLRKLPCRRVLVFLDSCFAGTAGKSTLTRLKGLGGISNRAYANTATVCGKGRAIMAACSENEVSQEREDIKAGVFTHALIGGLKGEADSNGNNKVDIIELYRYVAQEVSAMTNGAQTPVFRGTLDRKIEF